MLNVVVVAQKVVSLLANLDCFFIDNSCMPFTVVGYHQGDYAFSFHLRPRARLE